MRRSATLALCLTLAGCGRSSSDTVAAGDPPPTLEAVELPGMRVAEAAIGTDEVVAEALDGEAARVALEDAGFVGGAERTYTGGPGAFTRVVIRALAFGNEDSAGRYVGWLASPAGSATQLTSSLLALDVPSGVLVLAHEPDACCPRDVPIYLAAWQRGADVVTVRASGRKATDTAMERLVRALEEEL